MAESNITTVSVVFKVPQLSEEDVGRDINVRNVQEPSWQLSKFSNTGLVVIVTGL
jgi:hypothetical protein